MKDNMSFEEIFYILHHMTPLEASKYKPSGIIKPNINMLLDQYDDYMLLHKMFNDQEYLNKAKLTLQQLKQIS